MGIEQLVLNKDSNEVRRFIETMRNISKMLDANFFNLQTFIRQKQLYYKTGIV